MNTYNPLEIPTLELLDLQDDPRRGIVEYMKATLLVSRISLNKVLDWVEYLAIDMVLPWESLVLAALNWSASCPNLIESELAIL